MNNRIEPSKGRSEADQEIPPQGNMSASVSENSRRRLVKGALAAAPAVLALRGQSALAGTGCASPSRIFSGNLSPGRTAPGPCGTGFSPGYWKVCQHLADWKRSPNDSGYYLVPSQFVTCSTGLPTPNSSAPMYSGARNPGSLFSNFFTGGDTLAGFSAWRILAYPSQVDAALSAYNMDQIQLARHLIATYLNYYYVGASTFPLTLTQMQAMWNGGIGAGYCPIATGCSAAQLWNAQQIVCYLRNYTMDQASVSTDPVTWVC